MTQNSENKPDDSPIQPNQNRSIIQKNKRALSWWLSKAVTLLGLAYLFLVVFVPSDSKFKVNKIGNTEILLFAVILLFNSGLLDKLEDFSIDGTKIQAKFQKLEAEQKSQQSILEQLESQQKTLQSQQQVLNELIKVTQSDSKSLFLVEQQLNLVQPEVSQKDLDDALSNASLGIATDILRRANETHHIAWKTQKLKITERIIPIFKSLTKHETIGKYHNCHANLGYALKDKEEPEWDEALKELNKAIELRGSSEQFGEVFYEFNRAICRIKLYGDEPKMQGEIRKDLSAAVRGGALTKERLNRPINSSLGIQEWINRNGIKLEDL